MFLIKVTTQAFIFCYFSERHKPGQVLVFEKQLLLKQMQAFPELQALLREHTELIVSLDTLQNSNASEIFRDLKAIKKSDALTSSSLQEEDLTALLHFISMLYRNGATLHQVGVN